MAKKSEDNPTERRDELLALLDRNREKGISRKDIIEKIYRQGSTAKDDSLRVKLERDVEALNMEQEIILKAKGGKRYKLNDGFYFMRPIPINKVESLAMMTGVGLVSHFVPSYEKASEFLWSQLQKQLPEALLKECLYLEKAIAPAIPVSQKLDSRILELILDALSRKKVLRVIQYEAVRDKDLVRCKFSPWLLYLKHHGWYVIGEVHEGEGDRPHILRVDRIKLADVSDEDQPHPCEGDALEELAKKVRLDYNPYDEHICEGGFYHVKLRITGTFAQACMKTEWFPDEKKVWSSDEKDVVDYEATLLGLESMILWVMRAMDCIEVLEPKELRDEIDRRIKTYLERLAKQKTG